MKKGLLLTNLGSPRNPNRSDVRKYLREFLTDKRVIDLPPLIRYLLVYGTILPFRPKQTAKAYQAIWTAEGSPLLVHSSNLQRKLQAKLGDDWIVTLGMRYGEPSIADALSPLHTCNQLVILPLFPQYSWATTESAIDKVTQLLKQQHKPPVLTLIKDFYQHPGFIEAQAALIEPYVKQYDHILFSYHGLPERQLKRVGCLEICPGICSFEKPHCYKAQCHITTRELAKKLNLPQEKYSISFQSRLGKTPWIKPYTDFVLPQLIQKGVKRLALSCPSFVTDCLETLEEIDIRAKKQWQALGGEHFALIPCVNDSDLWVQGITQIIGNS